MWQYFRGGGAAAAPALDTSDTTETTSSSNSATSSSSAVARLTSYVSDKAAEVAFDLAPVENNLSLLRISAVLVELSRLVYDAHAGDVGRPTHVDLPLRGSFSNQARVACKLLHFREAPKEAFEGQSEQLQSPQQYGFWQVDGLGLVVAFRGTSSWNDVFVDINVRPTPLTTEQGTVPGTQVHSGFWEGAKEHIQDIKQFVQQQNRQARQRLPVWITGHSLGGGYANCMMLHLLANRQTSDLFSAGGGSVTFGAPMVLYSDTPAVMYQQLHALERAAEGRGRKRKLQIHNFVNNADAVPRFLGGSLDAVHSAVEFYVPSMSTVRETSKNYLPFGVYHFIHGSQIRTPDPQKSSTAGSGANHAEYAEQVEQHLDAKQLLKIAWLTGGKTGGLMDHKMVAYQGRIQHHMDQLAMKTFQEQSGQMLQPEAEGIASAKLFEIAADAQQTSSAHLAVLDDIAHQLGTAGKSVISEWAPGVGNAAMAAASRQWSSYWRPANASS